MNNQSKSKSLTLKLLGALGVAALTASLPLAANAQSDRVGNDSPRQERNPSQHPELFTAAAKAPEAPRVQRVPRRSRATGQEKAIFVITPAAPARTDDVIGNDAPHQERNPSAHPELFVR